MDLHTTLSIFGKFSVHPWGSWRFEWRTFYLGSLGSSSFSHAKRWQNASGLPWSEISFYSFKFKEYIPSGMQYKCKEIIDIARKPTKRNHRGPNPLWKVPLTRFSGDSIFLTRKWFSIPGLNFNYWIDVIIGVQMADEVGCGVGSVGGSHTVHRDSPLPSCCTRFTDFEVNWCALRAGGEVPPMDWEPDDASRDNSRRVVRHLRRVD